ncbi:MAG: hypothetical protein RMK18_01460 [Armatimonadota bacterium]|nr:hypothetical protein [Armatimonadota bacterium]MDW8024523.1 hypothetical protein [Armatimonadota bacterium]
MKVPNFLAKLSSSFLFAIIVSIITSNCHSATFIVENGQLRLGFGGDGKIREIFGKSLGEDYSAAVDIPVASITLLDGKRVGATWAILEGNVLKLRFDSYGSASLKIESKPEAIIAEVLSLDVENVAQLSFLQFPVRITENVGNILATAWDKEFGIVFLGLNLKTHPTAIKLKDAALLQANGYRQFGFVGCSVAIVGAPTSQLRMAIYRAAKATGLPAPEFNGKPIHLTEENRRSYLFTNVTEANVEKCIKYAKEMNFGQIMIFQWIWAKTSGHFEFNTSAYPNGIDGLKTVASKIRAAGLKVGFHVWASKVHKNDKYCTPIPDGRLWKKAKVTLAKDIDENDDTILTKEPPIGFYGEKGDIAEVWRDIQIGDEIVTYKWLSLKPPYGFFGCKRGANGTRPSAHKAGKVIYQLGIDDCCPGYIIDQETDLIDEMHERLAKILNAVGCDMIYFDGGEDVPPPIWHYVPKFELSLWHRLEPKPIVVQGTIVQHHSWHIFSRNSTVDIRKERSKEHVDNSVKYMLRMRENLLPGELGWFGIFPPQGKEVGTQFDEVDYLCCKSLAYDAPFSIEMPIEMLEKNPLFPSMVRQIRIYETLRLKRYFKPQELEPLKEPQVDFTIFNDGKRWRLIKLRQVNGINVGDFRLFIGKIDGKVVAYFWNAIGESEIELKLPQIKCHLVDDFGKTLKIWRKDGTIILPLEPVRRFLVCEGLSERIIEDAFKSGQSKRIVKIFIQAESGKLSGRMKLGKEIGVIEPMALGDFVTFVGDIRVGEKYDGDFAEYEVEVPVNGVYAIWARLRYPKGGDMSFWLSAGSVTENWQILGNSGSEGDRWHWDSQGYGLACKPGTRSVLLKAVKKRIKFRIYPREGSGGLHNPRLDAICITNDLTYVPNDEDAKAMRAN